MPFLVTRTIGERLRFYLLVAIVIAMVVSILR